MTGIEDLVKGGLSGIGDIADKLVKDFKADPNKVIDANVIAEQLKSKIEEAKINLIPAIESEYTKRIQTVNETMQAEDKSEHFLTYSWRPIVGYTFCSVVINNYILYPYLYNYGVVMLDIPTVVWVTMGSILGVNAIGRTLEKIQSL